jgi:hypothetical protein
MNRSPGGLERMLAELAVRADADQPADRVSAIHARARRAEVARAGAVVGVVVTIIVLVAGTVDHGGPLWHRDSMTGPAASAAAARTPRAPYLTIDLARDAPVVLPNPPIEGITVVIEVTLKGLVPQLSGTVGHADKPGTDNLSDLRLDWGDAGANSRHSDETCVASAPLLPVDTDYVASHVYAKPGTYTVTYTARACDPVGKVSRTLVLTVK